MCRNQKGISIIELLVSMMLISIIFTALLQVSIMATSSNMENSLREEAAAVAEQRMNEARNRAFAAIVSDIAPVAVTRSFRGVQNFSYNTQLTVQALTATSIQLTMTVTWTYKTRAYTHSISTVVTSK